MKGRLNFDFHVDTPIRKASKKCHPLARVSNYMDSDKRHVLTNAFIKFQLSYCPLVWMFLKGIWTIKSIGSMKKPVYRIKTSFLLKGSINVIKWETIQPWNEDSIVRYISVQRLYPLMLQKSGNSFLMQLKLVRCWNCSKMKLSFGQNINVLPDFVKYI